MQGAVVPRVQVIVFVVLVGGCSHRKSEPAPAPPTATGSAPAPAVASGSELPTNETIRASEQTAAERQAQRSCNRRVAIYDGSIAVDATTYVEPVAHGDAWTDEPVSDLDRVVSTAPRIDFTLDYPFEKPFTSSITGDLTRRRIIDAVRAAFRHMYEGTTQRDIPKMYNKDVRGPYGRAFHVIGDLVIEGIDLCDDRWLDINIGS